MEANDVNKGGSFYLQSKFYRANELLQEYIAEQQKITGTKEVPITPPEEEGNSEQQQQSASSQSPNHDERQQKQ